MIQLHTQSHTVSKFNVLAQPTFPMTLANSVLSRLADLSNQKQWILFTAQCPRPDFAQLSAYDISCSKIIQMKSSQKQREFDIAAKAIKSGNASAVVASNLIPHTEQAVLQSLASKHQCDVFFVDANVDTLH